MAEKASGTIADGTRVFPSVHYLDAPIRGRAQSAGSRHQGIQDWRGPSRRGATDQAIVGLESQVTGQELSTPVSEAPVRIRVLGNGDHDVARFDTAATLQFIAE